MRSGGGDAGSSSNTTGNDSSSGTARPTRAHSPPPAALGTAGAGLEHPWCVWLQLPKGPRCKTGPCGPLPTEACLQGRRQHTTAVSGMEEPAGQAAARRHHATCAPLPAKLSRAPSLIACAMAASAPTPSPLGDIRMAACCASLNSAAASARRLRGAPSLRLSAACPSRSLSFLQAQEQMRAGCQTLRRARHACKLGCAQAHWRRYCSAFCLAAPAPPPLPPLAARAPGAARTHAASAAAKCGIRAAAAADRRRGRGAPARSRLRVAGISCRLELSSCSDD